MIPNNTISIRQATPHDALAIKEIHNAAYKISYRGYLPDDFLDSLKIDEDIIKKTEQYLEQTECYVASVKDKIVGFLYINYPEDNILELQALYIHPKYQKCGVGTALIQHVWKKKLPKKYNKCIVWTMKFGPSLDFYKKMGFSMTDTEKNWKKFNIPVAMLEKDFA